MNLTINQLISSQIPAGQKILLSGTIYTARDAAHKRIIDMLNAGHADQIPFKLKNAAIYYCGPTPTKPNTIIGSCGPTTSARMDIYTPQLLSEGVKILIGKGARSKEVVDAIALHKANYLVATGGVGALLSKTIVAAKIIAFEDLGTEAVHELEIKDMPLYVAIDCTGKKII